MILRNIFYFNVWYEGEACLCTEIVLRPAGCCMLTWHVCRSVSQGPSPKFLDAFWGWDATGCTCWNRASQPCSDVAMHLFLRVDVALCKHLCTNSIPGSWWSNVVLEKTALEFTQRLLSKRLSPSLMQRRYEESADMKKLFASLSLFKTFPCAILSFAFSQSCSCNGGLF